MLNSEYYVEFSLSEKNMEDGIYQWSAYCNGALSLLSLLNNLDNKSLYVTVYKNGELEFYNAFEVVFDYYYAIA